MSELSESSAQRHPGPCREGLAGVVGGQHVPGSLGGDRRIRPRPGAGLRLLVLGFAVSWDRGGLAGAGRAADRFGGRGSVTARSHAQTPGHKRPDKG